MRLGRAWGKGALVLLPLILYAPFLFGGKVLYWGVYLLQFYPWRQLAVEQIKAGHWPLWNPYLGAGTPLSANLQTAAFYPPNILFLLMPVERGFAWELALHVAIAGLSAYALGRTLSLSRFGALVSGLAYGCGGYVVARWVFPSMVSAAAWLPLLLALAERVVRHAGPAPPSSQADYRSGPVGWLSNVALLATAIALQLLAGHAQTSYYSAWIVGAFALYRLLRRRPDGQRPGVRPLLLGGGALLLAAVWGVALGAVQLLPTAELVAHSQRAGRLTDATFAFELSFWPWRLITLLAPDFYGNPARGDYWAYGTYWEEAAYIGLLPLALAVAAVITWWRRRTQRARELLSLVPFFALLAAFSLVLALGDHTPVYTLLFRVVPGFGLFQAPARLMIGYALGMALLAGIGADLLRLTSPRRAGLHMALVAGVGIAIAGGAARLALPAVQPSFGASAIRLGLTLTLTAGVLLLRVGRLQRAQWQALAIALIAADLLAFGWGLAPGTDPAVYRAPVATAEILKEQPPGRVYVAEPYAQEVYDQYVSLSAFGPSDPATLQGLRESLLPNLNAVHHLPGVGNYDPLTIAQYRDLYDLLRGEPDTPASLEQSGPILNLFGARYLVSDEASDLPVLYGEGPRIHLNDQALPEAYIVPKGRVVEDTEARLSALVDPSFDAHSEVLLSHPTRGSSPSSPGQVDSPPPTILREGPNRVIIGVNMHDPGYLVFTDTYYPGWRATVDGAPVDILPANHAFRAVPVEGGQHKVVFDYDPLSFRLGGWITAGAVLALATAVGTAMIQSKQRLSFRPKARSHEWRSL